MTDAAARGPRRRDARGDHRHGRRRPAATSGASLGTVELTIALHAELESPRDRIVWDVGHQAYGHKLLTGRLDGFATLRQHGGISGFLRRDESEHDIMGAGHASTSISYATGLAEAQRHGRQRRAASSA